MSNENSKAGPSRTKVVLVVTGLLVTYGLVMIGFGCIVLKLSQ